jgi:hypothetical protein
MPRARLPDDVPTVPRVGGGDTPPSSPARAGRRETSPYHYFVRFTQAGDRCGPRTFASGASRATDGKSRRRAEIRGRSRTVKDLPHAADRTRRRDFPRRRAVRGRGSFRPAFSESDKVLLIARSVTFEIVAMSSGNVSFIAAPHCRSRTGMGRTAVWRLLSFRCAPDKNGST